MNVVLTVSATPQGKKVLLFRWIETYPRRLLALIFVACASMLAFGMYLQHVGGLEPCPMCIVQRYALVGVGLLAALAALFPSTGNARWGQKILNVLAVVTAGFGAFVAARQTWLQWYPPENYSCGRDFYGIIESYPISRAIPMLFRGAGDCTAVDWTFLGGSVANWSFVCFTGLGIALVLLLFKGGRATMRA